jgi:hypothetical protein
MIRLHIVAEGQTEEQFVNSVVANHLGAFDISTDVRRVITSRSRTRVFRGGLLDYGRAKKDLQLWMKEDQNRDAYFTCMFDLYALPRDFPEFEACRRQPDPYDRVTALETAFAKEIGHPRFIPYIQLHEFEALVLSDPTELAFRFLNRNEQIRRLVDLSSQFQSPELIDDSPTGAPSKRIIYELPEYEGAKASAGPLIAGRIGIPRIREKCPHFDQWLTKLEQMP